jgi:hypothetical protein
MCAVLGAGRRDGGSRDRRCLARCLAPVAISVALVMILSSALGPASQAASNREPHLEYPTSPTDYGAASNAARAVTDGPVGAASTAAFGIDGSATGGAIKGSSVSAELTTKNPDDLIVAEVTANGAVPASSCSDTSSLTWHSRVANMYPAGGSPAVVELYAVSTNALSSDKITCWLAITGNLSLIVFGVSGANLTSPFDPSGSLPASAVGGSGSEPSVSVTTSNGPDMIVGTVSNMYSPASYDPPYGNFTFLTWAAANETKGTPPGESVAYNVVDEPGTYGLSFEAPSTARWTVVADAIRSATEFPVKFTETGTLCGAWSVTMAGTTHSSSGSSITVDVSNGKYSYTVSMSSGCNPSPAAGSLTVAGGSVSVSITILYTVSFTESGKLSPDAWTIELNQGPGCPDGCPQGSSTGSTISFALAVGSYTYIVYLPGSETASPSSGSFEVEGYPGTISITVTSPYSSERSWGNSTVGETETGYPPCDPPLNMTVHVSGSETGGVVNKPTTSLSVSWGTDTPDCTYVEATSSILDDGPYTNSTGTFYESTYSVSLTVTNEGSQEAPYSFTLIADAFNNGEMFYQISPNSSGVWSTNWVMLIVGWAFEIGEGLLKAFE